MSPSFKTMMLFNFEEQVVAIHYTLMNGPRSRPAKCREGDRQPDKDVQRFGVTEAHLPAEQCGIEGRHSEKRQLHVGPAGVGPLGRMPGDEFIVGSDELFPIRVGRRAVGAFRSERLVSLLRPRPSGSAGGSPYHCAIRRCAAIRTRWIELKSISCAFRPPAAAWSRAAAAAARNAGASARRGGCRRRSRAPRSGARGRRPRARSAGSSPR